METVDALRLRVEERDQWLREIASALLAAGVDGNLNVPEGVATLAKRLAAAEERARRLEEALLGLVEQLDRVHADPSYQGVWGLYAAHGCKYVGVGLTYVVEQEAARALLAPPPEAEKKGGEQP